MATPKIKQKSTQLVVLNGSNSNGPHVLTLPGDIGPGNAIVVFASSWNFQETGVVVGGVQDEDGNTFNLLARRETLITSHGHIEIFGISDVSAKAGGLDITVTLPVQNGWNRVTLVAVEYENVHANAFDTNAAGTGAAGANATGVSATMAATPDTDGSMIVGAASLMWPNTPKNWGYPSGHNSTEERADTADESMAIAVSSKLQTTATLETLTWSFTAQEQGAAAAVIVLRPSEEIARKISFTVDADGADSAGTLVSVFKPATNAAEMHGDLLFKASGSDVIVNPQAGDGTVTIEVTVPANISLQGLSSVVCIGRGQNPADASAWWGSHFINGAVDAVDPWQLTVNGTRLDDYQGNEIKLRGINVYAGAIPYHLPLYYQGNNNGAQGLMDEVCAFVGQQATIQWIKQQFGASFNIVRMLVSPLALRQSIPGTYDYPDMKTRMDAVAQTCLDEGIWLLVCPYGMGKYGDFESRARKNQDAANGNPAGNPAFANDDDANQPPEDGQMDEYNSKRLQNGTASTVAASWMTTEIMACHDDLAAWAANWDNVLLQLINEPRLQTDQTYQEQSIALINNLRAGAKYPVTKPIFVHGPDWSTKLPASAVTAIRAVDNNLVFGEDHYSDQNVDNGGSNAPQDEMWPEFSAAASAGACVGVIEWGPSYSGANFGQPLASYATWADDYNANLGSPPVKIYWMALWDMNGIFGDPTVPGVEDWHPGNFPVVNNPSARELNKWTTDSVIANNAL